MIRPTRLILTLLFLSWAGVAPAQESPTLLQDLRAREYAQIRQHMIAAAELMPAEHYSFRPVPQVRTFAGEVAHVAQVSSRLCRYLDQGILAVEPSLGKLDQETSKEVIVDALKKTFASCDRAFAALDEKSAAETVITATGRRVPRGSALTAVTAHTNEEYGKIALMLRLKGFVPPSTAASRPPTPQR